MPRIVPAARGVDTATTYRAVIDETTRVIERRARRYRRQVIVVVVISVGSVAWALGTRSLPALTGCLVLLPACGLFFLSDVRLVNAWRSELLARWGRCDLDLAAFREAVGANPALPRATTDAMLASLPMAGDLVTEQRLLAPTRRALAASSRALHHSRADALLVDVAVSGIVAGAVAATLSLRHWTLPLLVAGTSIVLRPLVHAMLGRRRAEARDAKLAACRLEPGFDETAHARLVASLR